MVQQELINEINQLKIRIFELDEIMENTKRDRILFYNRLLHLSGMVAGITETEKLVETKMRE